MDPEPGKTLEDVHTAFSRIFMEHYGTLEEYGIFCREDIFDSMLRLGANRHDAFSVAERIRKGYYHSEYSNKRADNDLPNGIKEKALCVRYLPSRGQAALILSGILHDAPLTSVRNGFQE